MAEGAASTKLVKVCVEPFEVVSKTDGTGPGVGVAEGVVVVVVDEEELEVVDDAEVVVDVLVGEVEEVEEELRV